MFERLNRLAPLSGIIFFVLLLVGIFTSGSSPGAGASGVRVIAFYTHHRSGQRLSDILFVFASAFIVLFAGVFRDRLRRESEGAATTALVGAAILAVGLAILSSFDYALASHATQFTASAAQALNTVSNEAFLTAVMGGFVFGICCGIAVLRASVLPHWLGYLALVFGIAAATPASFAGLAGMGLWTLAVAIILLVRGWNAVDASASSFAGGVAADGSTGQQQRVPTGIAH